MGAWGPALFSDDTACDVRDQYRALIGDGISDDQVTSQVLESFAGELSDPDEGPVVLLALAVTQSRWGRLDPGVAARALQVIDGGAGLSRWRDQGPVLLAGRYGRPDGGCGDRVGTPLGPATRRSHPVRVPLRGGTLQRL